MNLLEASKLVGQRHVDEAVRQLGDDDNFSLLYERTGRQAPDHRYVVVAGRRYPSKAFGFFVAQIAGNTLSSNNDMNVNQAVAPLKRLGYVEVDGPGHEDSSAQREARQESYYLALARPKQAAFRKELIKAYGNQCAISGCEIPSILEAAHIRPFASKGEDSLKNGILLRIDLHRLFDADELAIDPATMLPIFSKASQDHYASLPLKAVSIPPGGPSFKDWQQRWGAFCTNTLGIAPRTRGPR